MALAAFDTLAYSKKLIEAGFAPKQAEAQAELQSQIFSELLVNKLSTKEDVSQAYDKLDTKIDQVKDELKAAIKNVEDTFGEKFLRLHWMLGFALTLLVAILIKLFFHSI